MRTTEITNRDDLIDSRDVIERIKELETTIADTEAEAASSGVDVTSITAEYDDWRYELESLKELNENGPIIFGGRNWEDGVTLIADDYFEDYAQEFAKDIGAITDDMSWPATCIDWEQAARELQMDYTDIEFNNQTYWGQA